MYRRRINGHTYYCMSVRNNGFVSTVYLGSSHEEAEKKAKLLREELGIRTRGRPRKGEENPRFLAEMKSQARPLIVLPVVLIISMALLFNAPITGEMIANISEDLSQNLSSFGDLLGPLINGSNGSFDGQANFTLNQTENESVVPLPLTDVPYPEPADPGISNDSGNFTANDSSSNESQAGLSGENLTSNVSMLLEAEDPVLAKLMSDTESRLGIKLRSFQKIGGKHIMEFSRSGSRIRLQGVDPDELREIRSEKIHQASLSEKRVTLNTETIYLNPISMDSAEITLQKTGPVNAILRCADFSAGSDECLSWERTSIPFTDNGDSITFVVDGFSGYAGAYITIINVQSYPTVGGEWTIGFTTEGVADLTISASNGTIYGSSPPSDLEWLSLRCGSEEISASFDGSSVFYGNWSCSETGYQTVRVLTEGAHTQQFVFGDDVAYAFNWAKEGNVYNCSNCSDCNDAITDASSGDIIQLNASITDQAGTCISFGGKDNLTFDCMGNTIDGDDVSSDSRGINLSASSNNNTIRNCTITNFEYGVYVYSDNNTIKNVTASSNSEYGFYLFGAKWNTLDNVTAQDNEVWDIYLFIGTASDCTNMIMNATGSGNRPLKYYNSSVNISNETLSGLILCNADSSRVDNVTIIGSASVRNNGIIVGRTDYSNFTGINSSNCQEGMILRDGSSNNSLSGITLNGNQGRGIWLFIDANGNVLENITANYNSGTGIWMDLSSSSNTLNNVTASYNERGIDIYSSSVNNSVSNATANYNSDYGIAVRSGSTGTSVRNSVFKYNSLYGLFINSTSNSTFANITASHNIQRGISISFGSWNNVINGSRAENNSQYGIYLESGSSNYPSYNSVYNNFLNNTLNLFSDNESNLNYWNATLSCSAGPNIIGGSCIGGNYWTDPDGNYSDTCADANGNSICDSNYTAAVNNTDYLPLRMPQTYTCVNCTDCNSKISSASSWDTVQLVSNITNRASNCISFSGKDNVTFDCTGNTIDGTGTGQYYGIRLTSTGGGSDRVVIRRCGVQQFYYGMEIDSSDNITIADTWINESNFWAYGIYSEDCTNITFSNVSVHNSGTGIYSVYSDNLSIINSNLSNNAVSSIIAYGSAGPECNITITNTVGGTGLPIVAFGNAQNFTFANNSSISELLLCNVNNASIYNLTFVNQSGIYAPGVSYSNFTNISITNSWAAFGLSGDGNSLENLSLLENGHDGLSISGYYNHVRNARLVDGVDTLTVSGSNNTIEDVSISAADDGDGVLRVYGEYNTFTNITLEGDATYFGLGMSSASYNTFKNSRITNYNTGIIIGEYCFNNSFYNNVFDNTLNFYSINQTMQFLNTTLNCSAGPNIIGGRCMGGNYWTGPYGNYSDNCTDSQNDGICDGSHPLDVNDSDFLPLTEKPPWISFVSPTPLNQSVTPYNWAYLNATVTDANSVSAIIDWNRSLAGWWTFNEEDISAFPSFVQINATDCASANSCNVAFTSPTTNGNLIIVGTTWGSQSSVVSTITDDKNNTYTQIAGPTDWSSIRTQMFYAKNITGSASMLTINLSGSTGGVFEVYVAEYAGVDATSPLNQSSIQTGSGTAYDSGSRNMTQPIGLIVGFVISGTVDPAINFTTRSQFHSNFFGDRVVNSTGSYSVTGTCSGSTWLAYMSMFKAAAPLYVAYDRSSYGNDGAINGSVVAAGKLGQGMSFDGVDDNILLGNTPYFNQTTPFTVSLWVKPTLLNDTQIIGTARNEDPWDGIWFSIQSNGMIDFMIYGNDYTLIRKKSVASTISVNEWYHVLITHNGSNSPNGITIYVNGAVPAQTTEGTTITGSVTQKNWRIGAESVNPQTYFSGLIDDICIFNRALSEEEINASYNAGLYRLYRNFTGLTDGNYNFRAYAQDAAGNVNSTEERTLTVDTTPPNIAWTYPTPNDGNSISNNWAYLNTSISDSSNASAFIDWNNSLVAWWRMDDVNASGDLVDMSGNGLNVSLVNISTNYTGVFGYSSYNAYNSSAFVMPNSQLLNLTTYTFSFWVKIFQNKTYNNIFLTSENRWGAFTSNGRLEITYLNGSGAVKGNIWLNNVANATNTWYHIVMVYDVNGSTFNWSVYRNGDYFGSVVSNEGFTPTRISQIGHYSNEHYMNGSFDDIIIFNRSVSSGEIQSLYNAGFYRLEHNFTNLADGNYTFKAYAQDAAGNVNQTEQRTVTVDVTAPLIYFVPPTYENSSFVNRNWSYVNVSATDANNISAFIDWNRSLIGWWRFDAYNASGIFDNSSYNHFGTFQGGASTANITSAVRGKGMDFNGISDYVSLGNITNANLSLTTQMTISAWARTTNTSQINQVILTKGAVATNAFWMVYNLRLTTSSAYPTVVFSDGTTLLIAGSTSPVANNTWYHIVGVLNGTTANIYVNGVLRDSAANSSMGPLSNISNSYTDWTAIGRNSVNNNSFLAGSLDDVRIFNRALSPEEINASFNAGLYRLYHNFTSLTDGNYNFRAYAQDAAGNVNQTEQRTVTVDLTSPSISFASPTDSDNSIFNRAWSYVNASTSDANPGTMLADWNRSLVGWWRFNNEAGENSTFFRDWSTYGNNGTCSGESCPNETLYGKFGGGQVFDGVDDDIKINQTPAFALSGKPYTISLWGKIVDSGWFQRIISWYDGSKNIMFGCGTGSDKKYFLIEDSVSAWPKIASDNVDNYWHHIVVTSDGAGNYNMYLDGVNSPGSYTSGNLNVYTGDANTVYIGQMGDDSIYTNGTIDEVQIWNRSLTEGEINASYNAGLYRLSSNFTGLNEGDQSYTIFSQDLAGNVNSTSRAVTVDLTKPQIQFIPPTPDNNTGRSFQFGINASIYDLHFANVTYNWNGTNTTYNTSMPEITNLGGNAWTFSITQTNLSTGKVYRYYIVATDVGGNSNQTEIRTVVGNMKPGFVSMSRSPSGDDDMDPNITLTVTANVSDTDNNLDVAILQWKNASASWGDAANVSMQNQTAKGFFTNFTASFTPTYESNFTYRIWANDTEGEWNTSVPINISVFYDWTWIVDRTNLGNTVAGGFGTTSDAGNFTIIVTGDFNMSFSINDNSPYDPAGYSQGCGFMFYGSCSLNFDQISSNQSAKGNKTYPVNATFGSTTREDLVTITILANPSVNATPQSRTVNLSLASYAGGPYIDALIDVYPMSMNQSQTASLSAYAKNIGNETAQDVSVVWVVPSVFGVTGNLTEGPVNMSAGMQSRYNLSLTANPETATVGTYVVYFNASESGSNNASDWNSVMITVYCNHDDGVCGSGCTYLTTSSYDPDCTEPAAVIITQQGSTLAARQAAGISEWQKQKLFQTEETYELVRSTQQDFVLKVENPFEGSFENVSVGISGFLGQYLSISPSLVRSIPVKGSSEFIIGIEAPGYFTAGEYELNFTITGVIVSRTSFSANSTSRKLTPVTEHRIVTLIIHEFSREEAEKYLEEAARIISAMKEKGLNTGEIEALLSDARESLGKKDFRPSKEVYEKANEWLKSGLATLSILGEVDGLMGNASRDGIEVPRTARLALLGKAALDRGDFDTALQRAGDAKFTFALESLGVFNVLAYISNNWPSLSVAVITIAILSYLGMLSVKFRLLSMRLVSLKKEEEVLLGLIKELQKDCFERGKLGMKEYFESLVQYEKKMTSVVQEIVRLEIARANMLKLLKGEHEKLMEERKKLLGLIKETQSMYLDAGNMDTRIYENKMRSYVERMAEIEESIAGLEAKRAMDRGRLWRAGKPKHPNG